MPAGFEPQLISRCKSSACNFVTSQKYVDQADPYSVALNRSAVILLTYFVSRAFAQLLYRWLFLAMLPGNLMLVVCYHCVGCCVYLKSVAKTTLSVQSMI